MSGASHLGTTMTKWCLTQHMPDASMMCPVGHSWRTDLESAQHQALLCYLLASIWQAELRIWLSAAPMHHEIWKYWQSPC